MTPALQFDGIDKAFFGVRVLGGVSFSLPPGHTLGLVGENGAGKSTLMNVLGGNLQPDAGRMLLDGAPYAPRSPRDAAAHGIAFIHQELNLFPNLTIAENLFLTAFPRRGGLIDRREIQRRSDVLLKDVGLDVPSDMAVERLSAGERQLVEIAKALSLSPRAMILDEPTTSLSARETERLFDLLGRLRERGISMIYISHALGDVLRLCDGIVVLRDGEVAGTGPREGFDIDRLVSLMVGRDIRQLFPDRTGQPSADVALEVRGVSQRGIVADISFSLRRGEVLGVSGLMGSGRTELARILFGLDPMARGEIRLDGAPIHALSPRDRIRRGLAFLTEDRRAEGLCLDAAIADNIALVSAPGYARGPFGWMAERALRRAIARMRGAVRLTPTARDGQPVKTLSGGNQQKVVLAKWLLSEPRVLVLDEPTRGVDVGARYELYKLIDQLAARGAGVLVMSSEIEELIGLCDRILVMGQGEIRDEVPREAFDRERILRASLRDGSLGATAARPRTAAPPEGHA
jgi:ribose transport system ATP-binding protein